VFLLLIVQTTLPDTPKNQNPREKCGLGSNLGLRENGMPGKRFLDSKLDVESSMLDVEFFSRGPVLE